MVTWSLPPAPALRPFPTLASVAVLLAVGACRSEEPRSVAEGSRPDLQRVESTLPACSELGLGSPDPLEVDTVAVGLEVPWDLAFLPDGRILVTERPGRIRVVHPEEGLRDEPWAVVEVTAVAEAGLLGIDVAPDFAETGHVFVVATREHVPSGILRRGLAAVRRRIDPDGAPSWVSSVVRFTDHAGGARAPGPESSGGEARTILDGIPAGPIHAGGGLRFGPEGVLHLTVGDGGVPAAAARPRSLRGKVLRLELGATEARGTPEMHAMGLRNPQGLDWHPASGELFAVDHGPTGLEREDRRRDKDELNRIVAGGDYGWPAVAGMWKGGGFQPPLVEWTPAIAPAGLAFVDLPGSAWHGDAFVTGLRGHQLRRVKVDLGGPEGVLRAVCEEALFHGELGRLRAARVSPDGHLYFATSNRDQRGVPGPHDDLLLRLRIPGG
jgi:aldose sugar dehydrogenase